MNAAGEFHVSAGNARPAQPTSWLATGIAVLVVASIVAPKCLHTLMPLLLGLFVAARNVPVLPPQSVRTLLLRCCLNPLSWLIAGFLVLRVATSPEPLHAFKIIMIAAVYGAMALLILRLVRKREPFNMGLIRRALVISVFVGAAYIVSELLSGLSLMTGALNDVPWLAGGNKLHFIISGETIEAVRDYVLNRNVAVLNFLFWPALLIAVDDRRFWSAEAAPWVVPSLCVVVAAATFLSYHDASKVALIASASIYGLSRYSPRLARMAVTAIWVTASIGVVPVVRYCYAHGLQNSEAIPGSARARVVLWNYEAEQVPAHALFGKGIDSVRYYDELEGPSAETIPGEVSPQRNGRHSHNIFLQVWYEFGLVGVALFMSAGLLAIRRISRVNPEDLPFVNASFVTCMTIASFSWGMWQTWYIAAVCFAASAIAISLRKSNGGPLFVAVRLRNMSARGQAPALALREN
ncbi:MAG: O-antigen ligase family protein [Hyphomicrobiaceae bacterium]